jgi:hypothetical protein
MCKVSRGCTGYVEWTYRKLTNNSDRWLEDELNEELPRNAMNITEYIQVNVQKLLATEYVDKMTVG